MTKTQLEIWRTTDILRVVYDDVTHIEGTTCYILNEHPISDQVHQSQMSLFDAYNNTEFKAANIIIGKHLKIETNCNEHIRNSLNKLLLMSREYTDGNRYVTVYNTHTHQIIAEKIRSLVDTYLYGDKFLIVSCTSFIEPGDLVIYNLDTEEYEIVNDIIIRDLKDADSKYDVGKVIYNSVTHKTFVIHSDGRITSLEGALSQIYAKIEKFEQDGDNIYRVETKYEKYIYFDNTGKLLCTRNIR